MAIGQAGIELKSAAVLTVLQVHSSLAWAEMIAAQIPGSEAEGYLSAVKYQAQNGAPSRMAALSRRR